MTREHIHSAEREPAWKHPDYEERFQKIIDIINEHVHGMGDIEGHQWLEGTEQAADAILDAMPAPVWQPIETAPKDGTPIDLWVVTERKAERFPDMVYREGGTNQQNDWEDVHGMFSLVGDGVAQMDQVELWMRPPTPHPEQPEPIREAARVLLAEITPHISKRAEQASEAAQGMHHYGDAGNANDIVEAFLRALEGGA